MLAITHVVATLLLIELLHLDRLEAQVAFVFGVLIDLDHLFGAVQYGRAHPWWTFLDPEALYNADVAWKSLVHKPIAFAIVAPLAQGWRFLLPMVFWGVHVLMDFVQESYLGLVSPVELVLLVVLLFSFIHLRWSRSKELVGELRLGRHMREELRRLRNLLSIWRWRLRVADGLPSRSNWSVRER